MDLQYLNWKLYLENPAEAEPDEWFKVFNGWIPDSPEIFIDVADYKHVQDGPVTVLVGHYVNLSLDAGGRTLGLLYDYKHPMAGSNEEKLKSSLLGLLRAALRLGKRGGPNLVVVLVDQEDRRDADLVVVAEVRRNGQGLRNGRVQTPDDGTIPPTPMSSQPDPAYFEVRFRRQRTGTQA